MFDTLTGRRIETSSSTLTTSYRYDSVGNLVEQVTHGESEIAFSYAYDRNGYITGEIRRENGTDGMETTLAMKYNKANQLTGMANGWDKIAYKYDKNGNMVQKVLSSRSYGKLTDI